MLRRKIKTDAKTALCNNWGKAICIMLVFLAVWVLFALLESVISVALGLQSFQQMFALEGLPPEHLNTTQMLLSVAMLVLSFLVLAPLTTGMIQWYYRLTEGESEEISTIFSMFSTAKIYFKTLWLHLNLTVRVLCWTVLLTGPGALISWWGLRTLGRVTNDMGKALAVTGMFSGLVLLVLGIIFLLILSTKYLLALFLYVESPDVKISAAICASRHYTRGHRLELFAFFVSFLPWYLLCIILVPLLYVVPYLSCSMALYSRYLIQLGRNREMEATKAYEAPIYTEAPVVDVHDFDEENE